MSESRSHSYGVQPDGFRLPDETRIGRVRLQVADLNRSLVYYRDILGLRPQESTHPGVARGAADGRVLVELHERPGARPASPGGTLGLFHFAMLLPDRAALGRFLGHATERRAISGLADHAVSEAVYLTDPDGLGIEIYADRPRSDWRVRPDGELYLTTQPLHVNGVLAAGGGGPWTGAPAGTTMGHVHLHVGDLERAAAFYHRAVGFDKIVWNYPGALFLSAGGYHHHLGTNTWSRGAVAADDQARLLSWDLETTDPDAVANSIARAGYTVSRENDGPHVADPWDTVMRIRAVVT